MLRRILSMIFLFTCLFIKSEQLAFPPMKIKLHFRYFSNQSPRAAETTIITYVVQRMNASNAYILIGKEENKNTLVVTKINCTIFRCTGEQCKRDCQSLNLILPALMEDDYDSIFIMSEDSYSIGKLLHDLVGKTKFNLTCSIVLNINPNNKPKDSDKYSLSKTSLFAIIFLSTCVVLVSGICIGWFAIIYYRRFEEYRMKKKLRKALEKSTQQMLEKSPMIIFDSNNKDNNMSIDDEPMCAICLELFKNKEKLRKLVCAHCFHVTCIDPWLLTHQSCPLCNRNILRSSIPSISSSIMNAINNHEETSIGTNDNIQINQAQN